MTVKIPQILRQATGDELAAAFTEWDRRWREDPASFESDVERILAGKTPENYGEACAPYFLEILAQQGVQVFEHRAAEL